MEGLEVYTTPYGLPTNELSEGIRCIDAPSSQGFRTWGAYTPSAVTDQTAWCLHGLPPRHAQVTPARFLSSARSLLRPQRIIGRE
eukprot:705192-Pyramimonas_sp.AAC.1